MVKAETRLVISFIIPAHNEEELLGRTLVAIQQSARVVGEPCEAIVVDDASTDRTAEVARRHGVAAVSVACRQIAAARNAGARAAVGDVFVFVDADTVVTPRALRAALQVLRSGAVGGGACVRLDRPLPLYGVLLETALRVVAPVIGLAGGCFLFCTKSAYLAAGGFDEAYYASEEIGFAQRLRRHGRFVVVREAVITSGRKVRSHSALAMLRLFVRFARAGPRALQTRDGLEFWYGPRPGG
jgi:glycosyltransferase involved in cell wall biosynthesis